MIYKEKEFIAKNGKKLIIKTPEKEDALELVEAMIKITTESSNFLVGTPEVFYSFKENLDKEEEFIKVNREGSNYFVCVYDENKIVGDCELRINSQTKTRHRSQIGIAILKDYQNLGIGSFLFDEMINLAKSTDGIEQIELDVVSTNDLAKHLYVKKGFVKTGTIPRQLKQSDGTYSDGEMMTLFLK